MSPCYVSFYMEFLNRSCIRTQAIWWNVNRCPVEFLDIVFILFKAFYLTFDLTLLYESYVFILTDRLWHEFIWGITRRISLRQWVKYSQHIIFWFNSKLPSKFFFWISSSKIHQFFRSLTETNSSWLRVIKLSLVKSLLYSIFLSASESKSSSLDPLLVISFTIIIVVVLHFDGLVFANGLILLMLMLPAW